MGEPSPSTVPLEGLHLEDMNAKALRLHGDNKKDGKVNINMYRAFSRLKPDLELIQHQICNQQGSAYINVRNEELFSA